MIDETVTRMDDDTDNDVTRCGRKGNIASSKSDEDEILEKR